MENQTALDEDATLTENIESLFSTIKDYGQTNVDLIKLKAADRVTDIISSLVTNFLVIIALAMFVIILNIGIALVLGEWLGKLYYGFFILAGFYLITGLIIYVMRDKWFNAPIADLLVRKIFK